jgi:arginine N-succinyltransferase
VSIGEVEAGPHLALCNLSTQAFRATVTQHAALNSAHDRLIISQAAADALQVRAGDFIRYLNIDRGVK